MEKAKLLYKKLTLPMMTGQHSKNKLKKEHVMKISKIICAHNILFNYLSHVKASNKSNDNYVTNPNEAIFGPRSVIDSSSEKKSSKSLADIAGDWMARLHK